MTERKAETPKGRSRPKVKTQNVSYDVTLVTDDDLYLFNEGSH
jgi:hypothetical protein